MQNTYQDQSALPALEGGLYDPGFDQYVESRTPGGNVKQVASLSLTTTAAAVAQVITLTITTAADADAFNVYIDGVLVATGTSAGTDKTVQRDALEALLEANAYFAANFTCTDSSTDALLITAIQPGRGFSLTLDITATSVWTPVVTTPNVVGTYIHLALNGYDFYFPCDSTTEQDERDSLLAALLADDYISGLLDMEADDDAAPVYKVTFTAKTAGVPFTLTFTNENTLGAAGSGTAALTAVTANVTGDPIPFGRVVARIAATPNAVQLPSATSFVPEGVSVNRAKARPRDNSGSTPVTGSAQYSGDEAVPVLRKGRIWVIPETSPASLAASVYVRHTQGSNPAHTVGRVRGTDDSGKVDAWSAARWVHGTRPGLLPVAGSPAVIEINLP